MTANENNENEILTATKAVKDAIAHLATVLTKDGAELMDVHEKSRILRYLAPIATDFAEVLSMVGRGTGDLKAITEARYSIVGGPNPILGMRSSEAEVRDASHSMSRVSYSLRSAVKKAPTVLFRK